MPYIFIAGIAVIILSAFVATQSRSEAKVAYVCLGIGLGILICSGIFK